MVVTPLIYASFILSIPLNTSLLRNVSESEMGFSTKQPSKRSAIVPLFEEIWPCWGCCLGRVAPTRTYKKSQAAFVRG